MGQYETRSRNHNILGRERVTRTLCLGRSGGIQTSDLPTYQAWPPRPVAQAHEPADRPEGHGLFRIRAYSRRLLAAMSASSRGGRFLGQSSENPSRHCLRLLYVCTVLEDFYDDHGGPLQ